MAARSIRTHFPNSGRRAGPQGAEPDAEPPSAEPPSRRAAEPPSRRAAEPPSRSFTPASYRDVHSVHQTADSKGLARSAGASRPGTLPAARLAERELADSRVEEGAAAGSPRRPALFRPLNRRFDVLSAQSRGIEGAAGGQTRPDPPGERGTDPAESPGGPCARPHRREPACRPLRAASLWQAQAGPGSRAQRRRPAPKCRQPRA